MGYFLVRKILNTSKERVGEFSKIKKTSLLSTPSPIPLSHPSLFETLERNVRMSPLDLIRAYTFTLSRSCVHSMYIHCFLDVTAHKKT